MELPKNYTQIGEVNQYCRVYLEDYVVSYIKQLNGHALDKEIAIGLFGVRKEEAGVSYLFLYGACQLNFLQKATRHLSQAVLQEAEKVRRKYFQEYEFLGCQVLNGERIEGVHVYEQGTCRYIDGYAHFYEKNDSMLQFMLEERKEGQPEEVNCEKYEEVKRRQAERKQIEEQRRNRRKIRQIRRADKSESQIQNENMGYRQMKTTVAAVFVLLGLAGLVTMGSGNKLEKLQSAARQMLDEMSEKRLPDAMEVNSGHAQVGTVVAEDKLAEAILKENEEASDDMASHETQETPDTEVNNQDLGESEEKGATESEESVTIGIAESESQVTLQPGGEAEITSQTGAEVGGEVEAETNGGAKETITYMVQKGDTLIGICLQVYGSDEKVSEVCELNHITNPDSIKEGEKILLPQ